MLYYNLEKRKIKAMIYLESINRSNWRTACFITDDPEHKCPLDEEWTTSTAFSIVQATFEPEWNAKLVMNDSKAIGFAFYGMWAKKNAPLFCRYTIDIDEQGKGFGQTALPIIVDAIIKQYNCSIIYLTLEEKNERAVHIYKKFGFVPTGERDEGEDVYVYEVANDL